MGERRENIDLAEARRRAGIAIDHNDRESGRWKLGLAVANGGGALAVSGRLLEADLEPIVAATLLPSAWMFVIGLIMVGASMAMSHISAAVNAVSYQNLIERALQGQTAGAGKHVRLDVGLFWGQVAVEGVAAVFFIVGVIYPLATYPLPIA